MKYLEQETMWRKATTSTGTPFRTLLEFQSTDLRQWFIVHHFLSLDYCISLSYISRFNNDSSCFIHVHSNMCIVNCTIVIRSIFLDSSFWIIFCGEDAMAIYVFSVENLHGKWIRISFFSCSSFYSTFQNNWLSKAHPFASIDASSAIFYSLNSL